MANIPVQFSPDMSFDQLIQVLNENFTLQQNQNEAQIISDTTGTQRIIIGRLPDGTYGIVVSQPGVNVVSLFQ